MSITVEGGIEIGGQVIIGDIPIVFTYNYFITETGGNNLVTETGDAFVEEY